MPVQRTKIEQMNHLVYVMLGEYIGVTEVEAVYSSEHLRDKLRSIRESYLRQVKAIQAGVDDGHGPVRGSFDCPVAPLESAGTR